MPNPVLLELMDKRSITIVGSGDVVKRRYLDLFCDERESMELQISNVIDIQPLADLDSATRSRLDQLDINYLQMSQPNSHQRGESRLVEFMHHHGIRSQPVVLATPTPTHFAYAEELLQHDIQFAIEKPFVSDVSQAEALRSSVDGSVFERCLFLFGYYLLEKSLPSLILARSGNVPHVYLHSVRSTVIPSDWDALRTELGKVLVIRGALVEGIGLGASLAHRSWALQGVNGANTLETFYHLVCVALPFVDSGRIQLEAVSLRACSDTLGNDTVSSDSFGETYTFAEFNCKDVNIRLLCCKYAHPKASQRWLEVQFENGDARFDFESCTATIRCKERVEHCKLSYPTRYMTQFLLFQSFLGRDGIQAEYALSRDALALTQRIRQRGLKNDLGEYSRTEIDSEHVRNVLY